MNAQAVLELILGCIILSASVYRMNNLAYMIKTKHPTTQHGCTPVALVALLFIIGIFTGIGLLYLAISSF